MNPLVTSSTNEKNPKLIPDNWDNNAHNLWLSGQQGPAIKNIVDQINAVETQKPKGLLVQLGYYLFLIRDYQSSSAILQNAYDLYPDDNEILLNLAVSLSRNKDHSGSITYLKAYLKKDPKQFTAWDSLASNYHAIGDHEKSSRAGTNALIIKDKLFGAPDNAWSLPSSPPSEYAKDKKKVITFSLWGNDKRYIFGALRNLLLAPDIYPDWELWFYLDSSVSPGFVEIIKQLGGKVIIEESGQSLQDKLAWRFHVANHSDVGYFLVRDIDSVFSVRECNAVQQWIESEQWFHIIRDWWTHTDLILAGLWGGVAGVLPPIKNKLDDYSPNSVSTPNIDQWFLRDCIWRYVKVSCLIHDRCFKHEHSIPVPGKTPSGVQHIGSCEYHQRPQFQEKILAAWIEKGRGE